MHWWGFPNLCIASVATQAALVHLFEGLINVLYRNGPYPLGGGEILKMLYKIFHICNKRVGGSSLEASPNAPLWHNPQLKEIVKVPDGSCWAKYGVKYAHQLFRDGVFRSFADLKTEYGVPNAFFFRYLQLRHAVTAQYGGGVVALSPSKMEKVLTDGDHSQLISKYYFVLLTSSSPRMERVRAQWQANIPSLTEESWSEALESLVPSMISARDKLTQFNYLHRVYYTPKRLHNMGRGESSECPRCQAAEGDFFHMVWQCPRVEGSWKEML